MKRGGPDRQCCVDKKSKQELFEERRMKKSAKS